MPGERTVSFGVSLILVAGLSSYVVLPRMEDPLLTGRVAIVNTRYPGADATRVEALVTEKLEEEIREIEEVKELRSASRSGISTITIELRDDVYAVNEVWSRVRDKLDDAVPELPATALAPEFEDVDVKAYANAVIVQPDVEFDVLPDFPQQQAAMRQNAQTFKSQILPAVIGVSTDTVDFYNTYSSYYELLYPIARKLVTGDTSQQSKFITGIQDLAVLATEKETRAATASRQSGLGSAGR